MNANMYVEEVQPRKHSLQGEVVDSINGIFTMKIDDAYPTTYIGEALPGTATSSAGWRIRKIDESASPDTTITWADSAHFSQVWDDRTTLSYA